MFQHRHPVDDAEEFDARRPHVGSSADRHQRHESAVGAAGDPDLFRIYVAGGFEELSRIDLILQISATQVLIVGLLELDAVSGGTAYVGCDAHIASGDESGNAGLQ